MKRDLRIIFMGTPDFAVSILNSLYESGKNIVGVITAPDKPAGRGRKLHQSAVKKYALEKGLHIMQPTNLKSEGFIDELKSLNANLQIVVAFRMLPKVVWDMPEYGTFNLHASLLPNYRGAAPINWAIINGERKTGVTTFFIDDKIDTGEIILSKEALIDDNETAGELHDKLMELGSSLVLDTVALIGKGNVTTYKQDNPADIKTAYKIHRDTCNIDWTDTIDNIYNRIRGLSPYPAAWTTLNTAEQTLELKIFKTKKHVEDHDHPYGSVITTKKQMMIAVPNGYIELLEIKPQGKKKMDVKSFLNGFKVSKGTNVL